MKEYYHNCFRQQFDEWIKKSKVHEHPGEGNYISIQNLNKGNLSHIPQEDYMLFHCVLACTVLIDQVMYAHFKEDYSKFRQMTRYPKIEAGITGINVNPWLITNSGIGLTTLERFIEFFVIDIKEFFTQNKFEQATWGTVKSAMLADKDVISGPRGEIFKRVLEKNG